MSFEYIFKSDPPKAIQDCCARVDSLEMLGGCESQSPASPMLN